MYWGPKVNKQTLCGNITRREFIAEASMTLASTSLLGQSPQSPLITDRHRPRFHLLPPSAWLNDPNGPLHWRGQYHLFYQYCPIVSNSGTKYWGHAVSTDLVHWKNLGIALAPTPGGPDKNGCWSGSAVVSNRVPTIVYTGGTWSAETERAEREKGIVPERQMVAVAADPNDPYLRKWVKIPENPVLAAPPAGIKAVGWRDPSLWKEGDTWYMVIGSGQLGRGGMALLYSSKNLRHFTYHHPLAVTKADPNSEDLTRPFTSMWECPEFFFLKDKPILLVARGNKYLTGTYSEHRFQQEFEGQIDCGLVAYAQKTMEDDKGRRIWWAWIHEKRSAKAQAEAGWAGVMSLPRLLTLRSDGTLGIEPVPELKVLRHGQKRISNKRIEPNGPLLLKDFASDCAEIELEIELGDAREVGLQVRSTADGSEQTLIGFDRDSQVLFCDTTISSKDPETSNLPSYFGNPGMQRGSLELDGTELLRLRVYIDASVIETFANGKISLSDRVYPLNPASLGIGLFSRGGTAHLRSMNLWKLDSISPDRMTSGAELFQV
jgi:beta-fructofuranosidase